MDAGLGGSFRKIASAAEGAVIAIGESFGGSLQSVTDALTESIGGFTAWVEENQSLVAAVAGTSVALVGTGATMIALGVTSQLVAAGMGTLGVAFATVSSIMKGVAIATTAVKAVTLATAGVFAFATGSASAMTVGLALVNAAYGVSPAFAGAAVTAWGIVGATLTALTAPSALATTLAGVVGTAWAAAAGAAASAWTIITGPIIPFIAAGAAAVAVIGTLVGVAGVAVVAGMDFGKAWTIVKDTVGAVVGTVKDAFDVIREAMGSGDYSTAAKALWLGVQAVFWDGVDGAMKAFGWLWTEAWESGKRFFSTLVSTAWKAAKAIAMAIVNPFQAAREIGTLIGELAASANGFSVSGRADAAKQELAALRESLAIQKERNKVDAEGDAPKTKEEKLQALTDQKNAGAITKDEFDAGKEKLEATDAYLEKVKALEMEIFALEKGADAAERKRLEDEKLTGPQIAEIERLREKKKAIEDVIAAQEKQSQKQVDAVFKDAARLEEQGVMPDEVFRRVMDQINKDESNGRVTKDDAEQARETARGNLDQGMEALRRQGQALTDAMRSPAEVLNDKLKEISKLQDSGVIGEQTALRAEDRRERVPTRAGAKRKESQRSGYRDQPRAIPRRTVSDLQRRSGINHRHERRQRRPRTQSTA